MSGLRAVSAVFATAPSLDAEQAASLHFLAAPMLKMDRAALRNEIEDRLMIKRRQPVEVHHVARLREKMTNDECLMTN